MYNTFIFGTDRGCQKVKQILDYEKANILVYIDNDNFKAGNIIDGRKVISPDEISKYKLSVGGLN